VALSFATEVLLVGTFTESKYPLFDRNGAGFLVYPEVAFILLFSRTNSAKSLLRGFLISFEDTEAHLLVCVLLIIFSISSGLAIFVGPKDSASYLPLNCYISSLFEKSLLICFLNFYFLLRNSARFSIYFENYS